MPNSNKQKTSYNVSVKLSAEDKDVLEQYAKASEMSMSAVFRKAVKEYMNNHPLD